MTVRLAIYNSELVYKGQKQFDCKNPVINQFVHKSLKSQIKKQVSVAYVLVDEAHENQFVGFYTINHHMIDVSLLSTLELGSLPRNIPCTRLVMLGIDQHYQGQKLGSQLMKHALQLTQHSAKQIGCFGMYLDADPLALTFYQALGFKLLEGDKTPNSSPMFLPLSGISQSIAASD